MAARVLAWASTYVTCPRRVRFIRYLPSARLSAARRGRPRGVKGWCRAPFSRAGRAWPCHAPAGLPGRTHSDSLNDPSSPHSSSGWVVLTGAVGPVVTLDTWPPLADTRCRGRELRSGSRPYSLGRTTSLAPRYSPLRRLSLDSTIAQSLRGGLPATNRPMGETTRSASSSPAMPAPCSPAEGASSDHGSPRGRRYEVPCSRRWRHDASSAESSAWSRRSATMSPRWVSRASASAKQSRSTSTLRLRA